MIGTSFILPAFKPRHLVEAIEGVLAQTRRDFELTVVDDAGPAEIERIVKSFSDGRISYFRNEENLGGKDLAGAWMKAMAHAKGEWCVLASDDDVHDPRFLEDLHALAAKYPKCDLFHARLAIVDDAGAETSRAAERPEFESAIEFAHARGVERIETRAADFMFRRSAFEAAGGFVSFPLAWYTDDATWMTLAKNGVGCTKEVRFRFRESAENISSRFDNVREKVAAAEAYKRWVRKFAAGLEAGNAREAELLAGLAEGIVAEVDRLSRYEMNALAWREWRECLSMVTGSAAVRRGYFVNRLKAGVKRWLGIGG